MSFLAEINYGDVIGFISLFIIGVLFLIGNILIKIEDDFRLKKIGYFILGIAITICIFGLLIWINFIESNL